MMLGESKGSKIAMRRVKMGKTMAMKRQIGMAMRKTMGKKMGTTIGMGMEMGMGI